MKMVNLIKLSLAKLFASPTASILGVLLFAFGVTIISLLVHVENSSRHVLDKNLGGIDLVAGAKGSPMQLILSTVFHADAPTGNISLAEANQLSKHPLIERTIPLALGDNYKGYRIVGTEQAYAELYQANLSNGDWFDKPFDATIGYEVARSTGLNPGDEFSSIHGFLAVGHSHDDLYKVTGVMERTGTVIDRLILTAVESVWLAHGHHFENDHDHHDCDHDHEHDHAHHDHDHHDHANQSQEEIMLSNIALRLEKGEDISADEMALYSRHMGQIGITADQSGEITALLVFYRSPLGAVQLPRLINENSNMQAAVPALELNRLFRLLGIGFDTLRLLAWLIIAISGLNIFIHLLNTLANNRHEIALIRALGGSRIKVFTLLITQGIALGVMGWILGMLLSRVLWIFVPAVGGVYVEPLLWLNLHEISLLGITVIIGFASALIPAMAAYRTDVHYTLTQN
jgi:putative ABC transport system permease protein